MSIAIDDEEDRIDVEHIENAPVKSEEGELTLIYIPKDEGCIYKKENHILYDEPVCQRAR